MTSKPVSRDYRHTQLDSALLSTPYQVQTKWRVIAGAPCSGKTTLIELLANQGYQTVPESARTLIEEKMTHKQPDHPLRADAMAFQREIKDMQLGVERQLRPDEFLFLDCAVPSCLAWYRAYGVDPNEMLLDCFYHRYASVFLLDLLPFCADVERVEEMAAIAQFLDEWQSRDYAALGYDVIRVPVLPPVERLEFILNVPT
jgi:predicted ATPase